MSDWTMGVGYTNGAAPYSVLNGSKLATDALSIAAVNQLPPEILQHIEDVTLVTATDGTQIYFPCPFKETEAAVALKTIEACAVAAIADLRYGEIAGLGKQDPNVKSKLKGKSRVL